jgi:3'-phosphoadenosine 5'-phosphosulfate sulfotransferase (PAPS reductase)/FAD synthetase
MRPMTEEQRAHLAGRFVIASLSGGKDSTAMCLWLKEHGVAYRPVFCDTGWESEITLRYIQDTLPAHVGEITVLRAERQMEELCLHKGRLPARGAGATAGRFCTDELKVKPMQKFLRELEEELPGEVVNAVGIRRAESKKRASMAEWEWSKGFDVEVWRPLILWSEQEVKDQHRRHGCPPNPLYLMGAERVGCWPCIYARKSEIRFIADKDPARIDRLRELERAVGVAAAVRAAAKGEELGNPPAWFQAPLPTVDESGKRRWPCWPIDRVVAWSRTAHGGRQVELFAAPPSEEGCMSWGLCETAPDEAGGPAGWEEGEAP